MKYLILFLVLASRAIGHPCECCNPSLPLGSLTLEGSPHGSQSPQTYTSVPFSLSIEERADTTEGNDGRGWLAIGLPPEGVTVSRLLIAMTESGGSSYWTDQHADIYQQCTDLRAQGWAVIQLRWWGHWWRATDGDDAGTEGLAARPATVIHWIDETLGEVDGPLEEIPAETPITLIGQSGGAAQAAYCLSHYGLDDMIDRAIFCAGPPMAAQEKSLDDAPEHSAYWMNEGKLNQWDNAFGIFTGAGPAKTHDADYLINGARAGDRWRQSSVDTGALDLDHPATDIWFLLGSSDSRMIAIGGDYHAALSANPSNSLTWQVIQGTGHKIYSTQAGRDAILNAITDP